MEVQTKIQPLQCKAHTLEDNPLHKVDIKVDHLLLDKELTHHQQEDHHLQVKELTHQRQEDHHLQVKELTHHRQEDHHLQVKELTHYQQEDHHLQVKELTHHQPEDHHLQVKEDTSHQEGILVEYHHRVSIPTKLEMLEAQHLNKVDTLHKEDILHKEDTLHQEDILHKGDILHKEDTLHKVDILHKGDIQVDLKLDTLEDLLHHKVHILLSRDIKIHLHLLRAETNMEAILWHKLQIPMHLFLQLLHRQRLENPHHFLKDFSVRSIYLFSAVPSIYLSYSVYLSIYLFILLSLFTSIYLSIYLSYSVCSYLSICLSISVRSYFPLVNLHLSIHSHLSIYLSVPFFLCSYMSSNLVFLCLFIIFLSFVFFFICQSVKINF